MWHQQKRNWQKNCVNEKWQVDTHTHPRAHSSTTVIIYIWVLARTREFIANYIFKYLRQFVALLFITLLRIYWNFVVVGTGWIRSWVKFLRLFQFVVCCVRVYVCKVCVIECIGKKDVENEWEWVDFSTGFTKGVPYSRNCECGKVLVWYSKHFTARASLHFRFPSTQKR